MITEIQNLIVRPGELVTAEKWNAVIKFLTRDVTGPNVVKSATGWHVRRDPRPESTVKTAVITAVGTTVFTGEFRDDNGDPIGDPFTIYCLSAPAISGVMGAQNLADCDPHLVVGDRVNVEQRTQEVADGVYVSGWWAVPMFTVFDCETTDCTEL